MDKQEINQKIEQYAIGMLDALDVNAEVEIRRASKSGPILVEVDTEPEDDWLGEEADTLLAYQHLLRMMLKTSIPELRGEKINVDIAGFRKRQEEAMEEKAREALTRAREKKEPVFLEPMSSYERRLVHLALAEDEGVETKSVGEEPNRRVMIKPQEDE